MVVLLTNKIKYKSQNETLISLKNNILSLIVMSFLGLTIGVLAGNSRAPVMDSVIPAVLTFLSGFLFYIFSSSKFNQRKNQILLSALSLIIFLMIGSWSGSVNRLESENQEKAWEKELLLYKTDLKLYEYKQQKIIDIQFEDLQ